MLKCYFNSKFILFVTIFNLIRFQFKKNKIMTYQENMVVIKNTDMEGTRKALFFFDNVY